MSMSVSACRAQSEKKTSCSLRLAKKMENGTGGRGGGYDKWKKLWEREEEIRGIG